MPIRTIWTNEDIENEFNIINERYVKIANIIEKMTISIEKMHKLICILEKRKHAETT